MTELWDHKDVDVGEFNRQVGLYDRRMGEEGWVVDKMIEDNLLKGYCTSPGPKGVPFAA